MKTPRFWIPFWDKDSFFDDGVQKALMTRHPSRHSYKSQDGRAFPIKAWKVVDRFVTEIPLEQSEEGAIEMTELASADPIFAGDLLAAVGRWFLASKEPRNAFGWLRKWRMQRLLSETERFNPKAEPLQHYTSDAPDEISKWWRKKFTPEALRSAIHKERNARAKIAEEWSDCWAHYFTIAAGRPVSVEQVRGWIETEKSRFNSGEK